jgi:hypothetical protein
MIDAPFPALLPGLQPALQRYRHRGAFADARIFTEGHELRSDMAPLVRPGRVHSADEALQPFDLLELDGGDWRPLPLGKCKPSPAGFDKTECIEFVSVSRFGIGARCARRSCTALAAAAPAAGAHV